MFEVFPPGGAPSAIDSEFPLLVGRPHRACDKEAPPQEAATCGPHGSVESVCKAPVVAP